jgi:hypothetical protein
VIFSGICNSVQAVSEALGFLQARCAELGLLLSLSKCELMVLTSDVSNHIRRSFPADVLRDPDNGESRVCTEGCFEFLGASIGSAFSALATFKSEPPRLTNS